MIEVITIINQLTEKSVEADPEILKAINDNFWELI